MEREAALIERAGALLAEADEIDRRLGDIERESGGGDFDRRIFDLRARLTTARAGLQVLCDRLFFYR